ncbi:MAG TPA: aldolase/citrate lyase family protein [Afifellaceae bacterium]|nr:aldolase/citrate lyase family protein [Afifellaceae bacterium]
MATFQELLSHKRLKVGTYIGEFATPGIGRILKAAGCEFAFVDMEHSGFNFETVKSLLRHLHDCGIASVVRPPSKAAHHVSRALDVGAQGVIPPMMETADEAETLVRQTKYPPHGTRGAAFAIAHDNYQPRPVKEVAAAANAQTTAVALIETAGGVANVDAIASVNGMDCLWLGHLDLSNSQGIPGEFDNPIFTDAVAAVMKAGTANGKSVGRLAGSLDESVRLFSEGCDLICYSGDVWLFTSALSQAVTAVRSQIGDAVAGGHT